MKSLFRILFLIFLLTSCDYFNIREKEDVSSEIIAIVNTEKLFKSDIKSILPNNISREDSLILVRSYVNDWAIKQYLTNLNKPDNMNYYSSSYIAYHMSKHNKFDKLNDESFSYAHHMDANKFGEYCKTKFEGKHILSNVKHVKVNVLKIDILSMRCTDVIV